jgi:hypothetical protein
MAASTPRPGKRDIAWFGAACWAASVAMSYLALRGEDLPGIATGYAIAAIPLALPFLVLAGVGALAQRRGTRLVFLAMVGLTLAWWTYAVVSMFVVPERLDAQSGLVFIFAPLYAVIAALIVSLVALVAERVLRG